MYVPVEFEEKNQNRIHAFLRENPFGVITTNGIDGFPMGTHLPFVVKLENENWHIEFHIANVNSQSEVLKNNSLATLMVLGANGYVSSSLYGHVNVPTYNYQAVHLYGKVEKMSADQFSKHLEEVVNSFEKNRDNPIDFSALPTRMIAGYSTEITGFRLVISHTEVAFKLSQNRNETDFNAIVKELETGNLAEQELAIAMRNNNPYNQQQ